MIVAAALALGGFVKGATGAGAPVVAVPVMASFFGVPFALAMMIVPSFLTNLWQMWRFRGARHDLVYLPWLLVMAGIGTAAGTWLLTSLPAEVLHVTLAAVILIYVAMRLAKPHWRIGIEAARRFAAPVGLAAGLLLGSTGISAPVSVTYLSAIGQSRAQFIFALSALFVAFAVVQAPALAVAGILTWQRTLLSAIALVPILFAMPVGNWLASRLSPKSFDRAILVLLAAFALKLIYNSGLAG